MEGRARRIKTTMKGPGGGGSRRSREQGTEERHGAEAEEQTGAVPGTSKNALRERTRVESLRRAYLELQAAIPSVPPNTKLSKLDVLVLATTYISHLSQLLEEDDARTGHDNNNNTTTNTTTIKTNPHCAPSTAPHGVDMGVMNGVGSGSRSHQRGLLHPVKKWPMRARLYAGVGATEAATLLTKHTPQRHHHSVHSTLPYTPRHPSHQPPSRQQHHNTSHPNTTTPQNLKAPAGVEFPSVESLVSDFNFVEGNTDKSYTNSSWFMPQIYQGNYMEAWDAEGTWGPGMTYTDPGTCYTSCQLSQPYTMQTGCWETWEDGVA